jgi:hypothetical protein
MEKMFVYPETLDSKAAWDMDLEDAESSYSRADIASHRCKLYRTLLEQRTASHQAVTGRIDNERTDGAHA